MVLHFIVESHDELSEKCDDMISPANESEEGIWKEHPNQIEEDSKKEKVPYKSHDSLLVAKLFRDHSGDCFR